MKSLLWYELFFVKISLQNKLLNTLPVKILTIKIVWKFDDIYKAYKEEKYPCLHVEYIAFVPSQCVITRQKFWKSPTTAPVTVLSSLRTKKVKLKRNWKILEKQSTHSFLVFLRGSAKIGGCNMKITPSFEVNHIEGWIWFQNAGKHPKKFKLQGRGLILMSKILKIYHAISQKPLELQTSNFDQENQKHNVSGYLKRTFKF